MKRFLICLMTLALILSASVAMVGAADYEDDASVWSGVQLHALYVQSNDGVYSDLAEDYYELWWEEEEGIEDSFYFPCTVNMRGFGMSPNGDYAYMGNLNGSELRGVVVYNTVTGVCTDFYYHQNKDASGNTTGFSFAKGIDADERGYVYMGFTYSPDYGIVHLGIAQQQSDGTLTEVSDTVVYQDGDPGAGAHLGINGVDVITIGEKTYCYVVVNYDYDALYCYDVTDPANPVLNTEFGTDGCIVYTGSTDAPRPEGKTIKELQYLDVDPDGTIWIVTDINEGATGVMRLTPDGSECTAFYDTIADGNIYSITAVGDFLLLGAKTGSDVFIVEKSSGEQVGQITCYGTDNMSYGDRVTRIVIRNDIVYVCNASNNTSADNAIYAGALSDDGLAYIQNIVKSLNGEFETEPEDTQAPETTPTEETKAPGEETKAPETTEDTQAPETNAPNNNETVGDTAADSKPADTAPSTDKVGEEEGCASLVISGGAMITLLAAAFVVSKRK